MGLITNIRLLPADSRETGGEGEKAILFPISCTQFKSVDVLLATSRHMEEGLGLKAGNSGLTRMKCKVKSLV